MSHTSGIAIFAPVATGARLIIHVDMTSNIRHMRQDPDLHLGQLMGVQKTSEWLMTRGIVVPHFNLVNHEH